MYERLTMGLGSSTPSNSEPARVRPSEALIDGGYEWSKIITNWSSMIPIRRRKRRNRWYTMEHILNYVNQNHVV